MEGSFQPGQGILEIACVGGQSVVTRARCAYPLKLFTPRRHGGIAWVYTSTYGGGIVDGDHTRLVMRIGRGATCVMNTQSSTKVYKNRSGVPCSQYLRAIVSKDAILVVTPDPTTCFAGALYELRQQFELDPGATLIFVDWLTSGRRACGERWAFSRFYSRTDIWLAKEHLLAERLLLDPDNGPIDAPYCLGRFHCLACVVVVGSRLDREIQDILGHVNLQPISTDSQLIEAASPIQYGVLLRILGTSTEQVGRLLRKRLNFLRDVLGDTPWARKW